MAKTLFVNGNPAQGILGTVVTAEFLNAVNKHHHTGRDVDGEGALPYAADTGAADAYAIALDPALNEYVTGMPIFFKAANANTGASTLDINGLGTKGIKKNTDVDLTAGDIKAGQIVLVVYDGTSFQTIGDIGAGKIGDVRISLSATPNDDEIKLNGASLSRTTYAGLWDWAQAKSVVVAEASWSPNNTGAFSSGDGATTFRVPDTRGEFPRFFDDSRGVDSGRAFGSWQADEFRSHSHSGAQSPQVQVLAGAGSYWGVSASPTVTAAAGGNETRGRNITFYAFIKYR
ncbi:MAG: hypothetical protein KA801_14965 [Syntrophorhabdaceae bacterium]|nr:hypothetical protein [Syntrophorhabdaceae bacterium]